MGMLKLMAVGDISLQTANDRYPFVNVKEVLQGKDILFGNLETVLSNRGEKAEKAVLLYSSPEKVGYLKDVDFDVLNVANNHILDLGVEGVNNTLGVLNKDGLNFIGAHNDKSVSNHLILERNGIKLGFLGYSTGRFKVPKSISINKLKEKKIVADIESIRAKCDFIIVSLHWGIEKVFYPSPRQIDLAHKLIDSGATFIVGHHAHVMQGIEKYKNGLIAYSLGNFQFDPKLSQSKTNKSIILRVDFNEKGIENHLIIPVEINNDFLPTVVEGQAKDEMSYFIFEISRRVSSGEVTDKWWFEEIAKEYLSGNLTSYAVRIRNYGIRHLLECIIWLMSPFCLRCYAAIIWRRLKRLLNKA